MIDTPNKQR